MLYNDGCETKAFDERCHYHKKHPQTMAPLPDSKAKAEEIAQHISDDWGPLESADRVRMIVEVRDRIAAALEDAVQKARNKDHMPPNGGCLIAMEQARKEGFTAGAREMREKSANVLESCKYSEDDPDPDNKAWCARMDTLAGRIREIPLHPSNGGESETGSIRIMDSEGER